MSSTDRTDAPASLPVDATNITRQYEDGELQAPETDETIGWDDLLARLSEGGTFWLTLVGVDRHPHTRPVFAVVADGALHVSSSTTAAKTRLLEGGAPSSLASSTAELDIVWVGTPRRVTDRAELSAVRDSYRSAYGWDVDVDDAGDALTAPYGAPTAGPPPYAVFRIDPRTVHAVATADAFEGRSTRWRFEAASESLRVDRARRSIAAPVQRVFDALVDPVSLAAWLPPSGMRGRFEHADIRPGGGYRLVLVHDDPDQPGKVGDGSDVVEARIVELVSGERVVQEIDFPADDPAFRGTMTMVWTVRGEGDGTVVEISATDVPTGISPEDHRAGLDSSLANLAAHVEGGAPDS